MGDLISRSALLEMLNSMRKRCKVNEDYLKYLGNIVMGISETTIEICEEAVKNFPAVDAVPVVHAHWKFNRDGSGTCSNCRRTQTDAWDYDSWDNYCSSCGAKMDGERK